MDAHVPRGFHASSSILFVVTVANGLLKPKKKGSSLASWLLGCKPVGRQCIKARGTGGETKPFTSS